MSWMAAIERRDGRGCVWCSKPIGAHHPDATVEHVHPQNHGGTDHLDNLLLACMLCNSERQSVPADEWAQVCRDRGQTVREAALDAALARMTATNLAPAAA